MCGNNLFLDLVPFFPGVWMLIITIAYHIDAGIKKQDPNKTKKMKVILLYVSILLIILALIYILFRPRTMC
jgi:hypothetical protein